MPTFKFAVYEVDSSYYLSDAQSPILSQQQLKIHDSVDDDLHRTVAEDPANDQTFEVIGASAVTDYTVQYLDFAQVNGGGTQYELYAMEVHFADGGTKYYVMSKDPGFNPNIGDDLAVSSFSSFTTTTYGNIGSAICYAAGTMILTPSGQMRVEHLQVGDLIQTMDNGCHEILWIGRRDLQFGELRKHPELRPIRIMSGAFGNDQPLIVSPQHRLLVPEHWAGCPQIYVRAKHIAEFAPDLGHVANDLLQVSYFHLLLARHEVIFANGAASESFFPGRVAMQGVSRKDRREVEALFPRLPDTPSGAIAGDLALARPVLSKTDLKKRPPDWVAAAKTAKALTGRGKVIEFKRHKLRVG